MTLPFCPEKDYFEMKQELKAIRKKLGIPKPKKPKRERATPSVWSDEGCPHCDKFGHYEENCPLLGEWDGY